MEYRDFITRELLNNSYGIYSIIADKYREQMEFCRTSSLFRKWLAKELEVPIEVINLNSLNSVLKRQRKKKATASKRPES